MIYLKENKINKFGNNKIYLKDKVIYQAVKGKEKQPDYIKMAFDYNSFTDEGVKDKFNLEIISNYQSFTYNPSNFIKNNENKSIELTISSDTLISAKSESELYNFSNFKSLLFKCENMNNVQQIDFFNGNDNISLSINFNVKTVVYGLQSFIFYQLSQEQINSITYVYISFNTDNSDKNLIILDKNFNVIAENDFTDIVCSDWINSITPINIRGKEGSKINFYYQCYLSKELTIDEIKTVDKYMMQ